MGAPTSDSLSPWTFHQLSYRTNSFLVLRYACCIGQRILLLYNRDRPMQENSCRHFPMHIGIYQWRPWSYYWVWVYDLILCAYESPVFATSDGFKSGFRPPILFMDHLLLLKDQYQLVFFDRYMLVYLLSARRGLKASRWVQKREPEARFLKISLRTIQRSFVGVGEAANQLHMWRVPQILWHVHAERRSV